MRRLVTAVLVGALVAALLAGCGGGGGGGGSNGGGGGGGTGGAIVISGHIARNDQPSTPVAGVSVTLGTPGSGFDRTGISNASGNFSITVPTGFLSVLQMYPSIPYNFGVSTSGAGPDFPPTLPVFYNGTAYDPVLGVASIPLPAGVLSATSSTSLGTVYVTFFDENNPPPPPF